MPPQDDKYQPQSPQPPANGAYAVDNPNTSPAEPAINNPLAADRPGEKVICEIKRHPIGMIGTYIFSGLSILIILVAGFWVAPMIFPDYNQEQLYGYSLLAFLLLGLLVAVVTVISHTVYWGNRWIVTDDSVTQVNQISLFSKQSSQLSMGNLEDVTAEQHGILAHMFNYGLLKVQTAGEHSKFSFPYCPNPNYYAQCILKAREAFEQAGGYDGMHKPSSK